MGKLNNIAQRFNLLCSFFNLSTEDFLVLLIYMTLLQFSQELFVK